MSSQPLKLMLETVRSGLRNATPELIKPCLVLKEILKEDKYFTTVADKELPSRATQFHSAQPSCLTSFGKTWG